MTAPPQARVHDDAVLALLTTAGWVLDQTLYDAEVPTTPHGAPYSIYYPDPGTASGMTITAVSDWFAAVVQFTHIGGDRREAQGEADRVRGVLLDARPAVPGRVCEPITQEASQPVTRDDTTRTADGRPVFYGVTQYRITSAPAPS